MAGVDVAEKRVTARTREWRNVDYATFHDDIRPLNRPAVLKGLVGDWPVVRAARQSPQVFHDYIRQRDTGRPTETYVGAPAINGVFFYQNDMSGLNFERRMQPFSETIAAIIALGDRADAPALYAPGAQGAILPDFVRENTLDILKDADLRLWGGNAVTTPTHYDTTDNVACVAAGRRRFTFFPPDQLRNLYIGPLDLTPGGMPTSLVRVAEPDLERYPDYAKALAAGESAELEAGDAVFIPAYWWHNVESLEAVNLLVNFWWLDGAPSPAAPFTALAHSLLAISTLPDSHREVWRQMFDHYVFKTHGEPVPYLPPDRRGMLGPMTSQLQAYLKTQIIRSMTRTLPKPIREQIQTWMMSPAPTGKD